jgi:predicted Zn finger-like uncharacterized protein
MKVQCDQCAAAYSVADDKVAGRKLKQKCRKCGAQMLIDGTALAHDDTPMAVPQAQAESAAPTELAVWHVSLDDTTQGPYTLEELAQHYTDGSIALDTLVCRDGWNDWRPAGEVQELLDAGRGPLLASVAPPPLAAGFAAPSLAENVTMGRDPFGDSVLIAPSPRVSVEEMQQPGAQRDGTVQFSMDQIRALSAVSAPSVPPPAPVTPGYAAGDGSGLIDMRALAEAEAKAAAEAAQAAMSPAGNDAFRPLRPSALGPMQGVSPLTLVGGQSPGLDFRTKVMASLAAFAAVVTAAVAIVFVLRDDAPAAAVAPPAAVAAAAPSVASAPAPAAPATALAAVVAPGRADDSTKGREGDDTVDDDDRGSSKRAARGKGRARRGDDRAAPKSADKDTGGIDDVLAKTDAPKKSSSAGSSIDDLLEGAINGKRAAPKEEPKEPASTLPKTASREDMFAALGRAKAKAASCKGSGVATAAITVAGKSGKATSINVTGVDGAAKSCVEKAVRSTSFPKFQNDSIKVQFPFKLAG